MSDELAERIEGFDRRMTSIAGGDEGSIAATVRGMSDDELRQAVEDLASITLALAREWFAATGP